MLSLFFNRVIYAMTKEWRSAPSIASAVSMRCVFPEKDIQRTFDQTQSWDMVLAVAGYASLMGHTDLDQARKAMVKENPGAAPHTLFALYGII